MDIILNGEKHCHAGSGKLSELLRELTVNPDRVAIMVNDRIVRKDEREKAVLHAGDRVEILTFMGGG